MHEIVPGEIIELVIEGTCDADGIILAMQAHYHRGLKGVLWNVSEADLQLSADGMQAIAEAGRQCATHRRTAHYSPHNLQFGLLRMYEAYAELGKVAPTLMAFRDRDEAIAWLDEEG